MDILFILVLIESDLYSNQYMTQGTLVGPNKRLLVGTFLCAVSGTTLRSTFCVPDTVLDVPDIIWNILPNNIRHIFLISDL